MVYGLVKSRLPGNPTAQALIFQRQSTSGSQDVGKDKWLLEEAPRPARIHHCKTSCVRRPGTCKPDVRSS